MCLIFVVNNIFQVNTSAVFQVLKKLLIKDESNTTDLFNSGFFFCIPVHKINSYPNGQLPTKFFAFETLQCRSAAICTDYDVEVKFIEGMGGWVKCASPGMTYEYENIVISK